MYTDSINRPSPSVSHTRVGQLIHGFFTLMFSTMLVLFGFGVGTCWLILSVIFGPGSALIITVGLLVFLAFLMIFSKKT